ncbi:MAG: DNA-processing protein DprA [Alphaproteobacteria bacterium]|nr:DNA-processing protein DprA [Alphaproteobacteria bacterium]
MHTISPDVDRWSPTTTTYPNAVLGLYGSKSPELSVQGAISILDQPGIGFCGSRKASEQGIEIARDCAEQAVLDGYTVVSGYAAGVDEAAHHAALAAGGRTIIVLPEGINQFRIRRSLKAVWDWDRVLVISGFEPTAVWRAHQAMARNRLIVALSRAMIVIEAGETGGTLDAGRQTLAAQKPLFVVDYAAQHAVGNPLLIAAGGMPLRRSRNTGRANLAELLVRADRDAQLVRTAQTVLALS